MFYSFLLNYLISPFSRFYFIFNIIGLKNDFHS